MNYKFSLLQYSISAAAILNTTGAFSQILYTDINPDMILDEPGEYFGIDLDDDGLNDFNFFNTSFTTTVFYSDLANVKALFAGAFDVIKNGINGSTASLSSGYIYSRPFALEQGVLIGNSDQFYHANYQTLAKDIDKFYSPFENTHVGNWFSWQGDIENHYIGFRFTDEFAVERYGWIRCSVIDSGHTLIIHDYAYELQEDLPIVSGDTMSYVNIQNSSDVFEANIYSFEKNIFVYLVHTNKVQIMISDITGNEVIMREMIDSYEVLDMYQFPAGVYFLTLMDNVKTYSTKLILK